MEKLSYKGSLIKIFLKSVEGCNPAKLVADRMQIQNGSLVVCNHPYSLNSNFFLIGFGKGVLGMASQCEKILKDRLKQGVIIIPESSLKTFENNKDMSLNENSVIVPYEGAADNLPDENSVKGTEAAIELIHKLNKKTDTLIVLITGGGSSLLVKTKPGIELCDVVKTIQLLTSSGADIFELNAVRTKLSLVKGGGLAALTYPVKTISLILSDVLDDWLDVIASGPTVESSIYGGEPLRVVQKYNLQAKIPENVLRVLEAMEPPPADYKFDHVHNYLIGNNMIALKAGRRYAESVGFKATILSSKARGTANDISVFYRDLLFEIMNYVQRRDRINTAFRSEEVILNKCFFSHEDTFCDEFDRIVNALANGEIRKSCILVGGESTLRVEGSGKGGRNQELALLMCLKINALSVNFPEFFNRYEVCFLSAGTDGSDGPTDAAGAVGETDVINLANEHNLNPNEFLKRNDSYSFFKLIDNGSYLITTGLTGTNVMDIHAIVIGEKIST